MEMLKLCNLDGGGAVSMFLKNVSATRLRPIESTFVVVVVDGCTLLLGRNFQLAEGAI